MQFVILKKRKSKVSLFKVCKCEDLMGMTAAMIEANIEALRSEKNISEEKARAIVKDVLKDVIHNA